MNEIVGFVGPGLGLAGPIFLLIGLVMMAQARGDLASYRRLTQPTMPIAGLALGGWGTFEGIVHPSEHGVLRSPVTGRDGVVHRISIFERTSSQNRHWERTGGERRNTDFYLVDSAGGSVRVHPAEAEFSLQDDVLHGGSGFQEMPPHLASWVEAVHGSVAPNMRVVERVIPVGGRLIVHGAISLHDGQRWTYTPASLERRLLIADPQSVQPGGGMLTNLKVGIVMTVLGAALIVGAIVVGIIS